MKKLQTICASLMIMVGLVAVPVFVADTAFAGDAASQIKKGSDDVGGKDNSEPLEKQIKTITNVLLFLLGAIAVVAIIIGGIRYATSNGDASHTKAAKDTILYAVIGLVVAILAYAIVNFVISSFGGK